MRSLVIRDSPPDGDRPVELLGDETAHQLVRKREGRQRPDVVRPREHARVRREGWRVMLEDLASTNGTYLNDERVLAPVALHDGDRIKIGDVVLVFHDPDITYRDTPFPQLEVDVEAGVVRVDRHRVELSPKEFALLAYLHERQGRVCSKDDIGDAVWPEYQEGVYDYQIENLVRRLRSKLELDPASPQLLLTVRGLGYKLMACG